MVTSENVWPTKYERELVHRTNFSPTNPITLLSLFDINLYMTGINLLSMQTKLWFHFFCFCKYFVFEMHMINFFINLLKNHLRLLFHFLPPENIRKPLVFWYFQGAEKLSVASNRLKDIIYDKGVFSWLSNSSQLIIIISFPLGIFSVNVTKFTTSCGFDHIYWRNSIWKIYYFCAVIFEILNVIILSIAW